MRIRFENRVFTEAEQIRARAQQSPAASYAKRFAAKEACAKALGCRDTRFEWSQKHARHQKR
jgi:phosphopantetheinyl transferase (holo-ACP synthase)